MKTYILRTWVRHIPAGSDTRFCRRDTRTCRRGDKAAARTSAVPRLNSRELTSCQSRRWWDRPVVPSPPTARQQVRFHFFVIEIVKAVVTTTIRQRFDRCSTPIRLQFQRATTIRRPTLLPGCCIATRDARWNMHFEIFKNFMKSLKYFKTPFWNISWNF